MATENRPLSPHLQVYRPQLTWSCRSLIASAASLLSLGTVVVVLWLLALAAGPSPCSLTNALSHPVSLALLVVWTFALFYHLLNGIRHLLWDAGWLLDLRGAYASGWAVLALSVILTAIIWGVLA
jgi:succinate dehydrogenase / fumarate reductase, cytochrome b subunit